MVAQLGKVIIIALLLSICSCVMVGPDYKEPPKRIAKHWVDTGGSVKEKPVNNAYWWKLFHDPTLSCLINLGYRNNYNLQSAAVKVLKARAMLAKSVGSLYPQKQDFIANLTYQKIGGQEFQFVLPSAFTSATMALSASWEIDFWGKYRRKILSDDAAFLSSYAAYDNALVSLTSDIARTYIDIRTTEELINVTNKNIRVQDSSYKLAKTRYEEGQSNQLDMQFAKTELYKSRASLPPLKSTLRKYKDFLGVLLGVTPDKVDGLIAKSYGIPKPPMSVAVGIPVESLCRRPDVYEARLNAIAQLEGIGAVKAILLPAIGLAGTFGFSSNDINNSSLGEIFNWANRMAYVGPSLAWPIFNYGQLTNMVRVQDASYQQALLNYLNVVLKAQQEVQDGITAFIQSKQAVVEYKVANKSSVKSTDISLIRYTEGESDFTTVLISQNIQLSVQKAMTQAEGEVPKHVVAIYRALGGGWQIRGGSDIVANEIKQEMGHRTYWGNLLKQKNHIPARTKTDKLKELYIPSW